MRHCMICSSRRVFGNYYFCSECYKSFKNEILANAAWVIELKRAFWREQKQNKRIKQNEVFLDDLGLVVGEDNEVYYDGEHEIK